MKEIQLTRGYVAIVDDEDFELVSPLKWHASVDKTTTYAIAYIPGTKPRKFIRMHQLILNSSHGQEVHHDNENGLDNRRENIHSYTSGEHHIRHIDFPVKSEGKSSIYKGVHWKINRNKWEAQAKIKGRQIYIGLFESEIDAAIAYDNFVRPIHGEFFRPNVR